MLSIVIANKNTLHTENLLDRVNWGTHFCFLYKTKQDLLDLLIPYFKLGLENNEFCIWITSKNLSTSEAEKALEEAIPNFIKLQNHIIICPYDAWYVLKNNVSKEKTFDLDEVLKSWVENLNKALIEGFEGIRITGDLDWIKKKDLEKFVRYEIQKNDIISDYKMKTICTYPINKFTKLEIVNIANSHQIVISKVNGIYKILQNADIKRIEEQKQIIHSNLENIQKMEIIGMLSSGVAHDLNNLLALIKGYAEMALMELDINNSSYEHIKEITHSVKTASRLANQMFTFSGKSKLDKEVININDNIKSILNIFKFLIKENIKFETKLDPRLWNVLVTPGKLDQILLNLIINARDAMPEGGIITISTKNIEISKPFYKDNFEVKPGKYVNFSIKDTGIGMDENIIEHIFEPFFTTKKSGEGTGLGLSLIYHIIKEYNGWIDVFSELKKGSKFNIYLPASYSN